jgi:RND family efflux transporter MFP subunit
VKGGARLWLPLGILAAGAAAVVVLLATRPRVEPDPPEVAAPLVRVTSVAPEPHRFVVRTQGTVEPRTESELVPQVAGEVVWVSPALASGGFFEEDEPLVRIDPADAAVELESTRAAVALAESEFQRAKKERARQRTLAERSVASESRIDDAENAFRVAEAQLREARARLARAERDLERTELRAPYAGRVREESVDVGQFVSRGAPIATLYAVDFAEVVLPIPDRELQYLDLPLLYRGESPEIADSSLPVRLHAEFAGQDNVWTGRIVRTGGEIDAKSRMVNLVARVEDPYGRALASARPPLAVGLFVEAEILGRSVDEAFVLPRVALRDGDRVLVLDDESRLRFRDVDVLRVEREAVVVGDGLRSGERVCVSPLRAVVDGMAVRVAGDAPELAKAAP